jgi:lysyl-tRNA synthetase, class II
MSDKIEELRQVRIQKLEQLKSKGIDPYPIDSKRTHTIGQAVEKFDELSASKKMVILAGRVRSVRTHGKLAFFDLEDETGKIQLLVREDALGEDFKLIELLDMGDFLEAAGNLALSKTGQKSLETSKFKLLSKSIRPIPQDYFGLKDVETRLRKRYLDLLANEETRELFRKKAVFWQTVREFMIKHDFLEVWTPVLENIPGGADAEPFTTHHNALDRDFYLRISLELPLKRMLVGGYNKVFEIGRLFRNEGIDREHLQEYDDIEFYWAYSDDEQGMQLVEKMYKELALKVTGTTVTEYEGEKLDWGISWPRVDYFEVFQKETGVDLNTATLEDLQKKADQLKAPYDKTFGRGKMIDTIYKRTVRQKLIQPCFLVGHPIDISPLAKIDPKNPKKVRRFQVLAGRSELGNGWAEVNDPQYQLMRFQEQMKLRDAGDKEAQMLDGDYIEALEYGMPPAVGFGMSERVFAILMNKAMRETVVFPPMKEE